MNTKQAFKKLLNKKDVLEKTSMTLCERSHFRGYFLGKNNRKPKVETMEKYLLEYGYKLRPEKWYKA